MEDNEKEFSDALHVLLHCAQKDTEYTTQLEQFRIVMNYVRELQGGNLYLQSKLRKLAKYVNENKAKCVNRTEFPYGSLYADIVEFCDKILTIVHEEDNKDE
jgi:hypothetical protein